MINREEGFTAYKNGDEYYLFYYEDDIKLKNNDVQGKSVIKAREDEDGKTCLHFQMDMEIQLPSISMMTDTTANNLITISSKNIIECAKLRHIFKQVLEELDNVYDFYNDQKELLR